MSDVRCSMRVAVSVCVSRKRSKKEERYFRGTVPHTYSSGPHTHLLRYTLISFHRRARSQLVVLHRRRPVRLLILSLGFLRLLLHLALERRHTGGQTIAASLLRSRSSASVGFDPSRGGGSMGSLLQGNRPEMPLSQAMRCSSTISALTTSSVACRWFTAANTLVRSAAR